MDTLNRPSAPPGGLPDPDSCYRALASRDARFDGLFFTGVASTGIYCRPVCPARTPRRSGCTFFASAAAAERAGYRPCLRCRPELAPYPLAQNLAHAIWQRIASGALNEQGLEALARQVGLSSRQLRRVLLQHFGVGPVELAQTHRLLFAKKLLQETRLPLTEVAHAAGFGSVRRFNALFSSRYRMTPGELRRAGPAHEAEGEDDITLRLAYRPPLHWEQLLSYLRARALLHVESIANDGAGLAWMRSVRLQGREGWVKVSTLPGRDLLVMTVSASLLSVLQPLVQRVREVFDLDASPASVGACLSADPLLAPLLARQPGLRVPGAFDAFELALRAILGQQVSVAGATTLTGRLVERFGAPTVTPYAGVDRHFPSPDRLAMLEASALASIGLPARRAATLLAMARFAATGGLQFAPGTPLPLMVQTLRSLPGIGDWTAQYIAMRALRQPDAFPAADLGLQKVAGSLSGVERMNEAELGLRAQAWSPWRAYAAMALWQAGTGQNGPGCKTAHNAKDRR